ncbi:hypothetical protein [Streptomyces sp. CRN 30]|uniref:type II toxin-antitoxin system VapC family toxin n=1 Tax=Streptomyces sp. CRN 30 TaxID=3075613 RepID=UPI002A8355A5|nr:hypothetical protein [Streptomyces sp. CRN 30]
MRVDSSPRAPTILHVGRSLDGRSQGALKWTLSRLSAEPVTQAVAQSATALLRAAELHGHGYAIDAMLCATALQHPGQVTLLTADVEHLALLTAEHPRISTEKV